MRFTIRNRPRGGFRIRYAVVALLSATVLGTIGFRLVEGWSFGDSLYVTVQTLTTVGYGDVPPHSPLGRAFAVAVMLIGALGIALAISPIVQSEVQQLVSAHGARKLSKQMRRLRDHYIICGLGRVGFHVMHSLMMTDAVFVGIEKDPQVAGEFASRGVTVLIRDATLEESLREAGVERARGLATCLPDDADNVYVALTARDLNVGLHIVARAVHEEAESKLIRAGANRVVAPTIIGGHRMSLALTRPAISDFMESFAAGDLALNFEQIEVSARSSLVGQELSSTDIRSELDVVIVSIRRQDGETLFNPSGNTVILAGDVLIAIGRSQSLMKLNDFARGSK